MLTDSPYAPLLAQLNTLAPDMVSSDAFVKVSPTSEDISVSVNGIGVFRIVYGQEDTSFNAESVRANLQKATNNYSQRDVAKLLSVSPDRKVDYRLPALQNSVEKEIPANPYFIYLKIMDLPEKDFREVAQQYGYASIPPQFQEILELKRKVIVAVCKEAGIQEDDIPFRYGLKKLRNEIKEVTQPIVSVLRERSLSDEFVEQFTDQIALRYKPERQAELIQQVGKIASIVKDLYQKAKQYKVLMPQGEQLFAFYQQLIDRIIDREEIPLEMFVIVCPRYGESDDYTILEEGISQTAKTYIASLPLFTQVLGKHGVPFNGHVLVNDSEENLAGGAFLERLGVTESYKQKCVGNVKAIEQALREDNRFNNISVALFTQEFPDFPQLTSQLEKQLFSLVSQDQAFSTLIASVADARLDRHAKIMGGTCTFSESIYLTLHYLAQYMVLAYLCRQDKRLARNSFIVNYNSPNAEYFNDDTLFQRCLLGESTTKVIPIFQVKYY